MHKDATGKAKERILGLAKALGSTQADCLEMTMKDEATLDLVGVIVRPIERRAASDWRISTVGARTSKT